MGLNARFLVDGFAGWRNSGRRVVATGQVGGVA
jgi:hypothetical protein